MNPRKLSISKQLNELLPSFLWDEVAMRDIFSIRWHAADKASLWKIPFLEIPDDPDRVISNLLGYVLSDQNIDILAAIEPEGSGWNITECGSCFRIRQMDEWHEWYYIDPDDPFPFPDPNEFEIWILLVDHPHHKTWVTGDELRAITAYAMATRPSL